MHRAARRAHSARILGCRSSLSQSFDSCRKRQSRCKQSGSRAVLIVLRPKIPTSSRDLVALFILTADMKILTIDAPDAHTAWAASLDCPRRLTCCTHEKGLALRISSEVHAFPALAAGQHTITTCITSATLLSRLCN